MKSTKCSDELFDRDEHLLLMFEFVKTKFEVEILSIEIFWFNKYSTSANLLCLFCTSFKRTNQQFFAKPPFLHMRDQVQSDR